MSFSHKIEVELSIVYVRIVEEHPEGVAPQYEICFQIQAAGLDISSVALIRRNGTQPDASHPFRYGGGQQITGSTAQVLLELTKEWLEKNQPLPGYRHR